MMQIFVGNLSFEAGEADVKAAFAAFGAVTSVMIMMKKKGKKSRGFCFVEMADESQARAAIAGLNGKELLGRPMEVVPALPKKPKIETPVRRPRRSVEGHGYGRSRYQETGPRNDEPGPREKREGGARPWVKRQGGAKPWEKRQGTARPWEKREGGAKPWAKRQGGTRPWEKKEDESNPWKKSAGGPRPWRKPAGEARPWKKSESGPKPWQKRQGGAKPWEKREEGPKPWKRPEGPAKPWRKSAGRAQSARFKGPKKPAGFKK